MNLKMATQKRNLPFFSVVRKIFIVPVIAVLFLIGWVMYAIGDKDKS